MAKPCFSMSEHATAALELSIKAGVIYEKDLITYDGEKIFLDDQGVTPDFHTKQAEKIFFDKSAYFLA